MLTLLWFSRDLRLDDNPALAAAAERGPVLPVFIEDSADAGGYAPGGASRWWLHGSLESLAADLRARGAQLILRRGPAGAVIDELLEQSGADAVYWNRRYEPWAMARSEKIKSGLAARGIAARSFNATLLTEPGRVATQKGDPFRVFTPFWRALQAQASFEAAVAAPRRISGPARPVASDALAAWKLRPSRPDWAAGLRSQWQPGEAGARERLAHFLERAVAGYAGQRNLPGARGTSQLSPHLHFGEIGPRQVWRAVHAWSRAVTGERRSANEHEKAQASGPDTYLSELAWREFSYHQLYHCAQLPREPLRPEFNDFAWDDNPGALQAWQRGMTGYPIVDAGMRELWHTGWMHNRVRMIAASFLVKDLLVDWRAGAAWFWDTLVDADLASNSASWQWVAGCGADAAPYFRVFNPTLQGAKFDPAGDYVRRWLPELAALPDDLLHAPWDADAGRLAAAGVTLGRNYPAPIVDHASARQRALWAFEQIRGGRKRR